MIKAQADVRDPWDGPKGRRPGPLSNKLIRLVKEVQSCPGGTYSAFHLYVFLMARVFFKWDVCSPFGIGSELDSKTCESLLLCLVHDSRRNLRNGKYGPSNIFFNFALAKRTIWSSIPPNCSTCASRAAHPSVPNPPFDDPFSPCRRANSLTLIERLQQEAFGEIKSGIMLTLTSKLPKELCLLVWEFAMAVEDVPMDPMVYERDDGDDDAALPGSNIGRYNWKAKATYRCRESLSNPNS